MRTARRRPACQIETGELLKRFADLGGEGVLDFSPFMDHRKSRRQLRGQRQAPGAEGSHELLPGGHDLIEREERPVQRRDLEFLVLGLRPREPRSLAMHAPPFCSPSRPVLEEFDVTLHRTDEFIFPLFPRDHALSSKLVDTLLGQVEEVGERRGG